LKRQRAVEFRLPFLFNGVADLKLVVDIAAGTWLSFSDTLEVRAYRCWVILQGFGEGIWYGVSFQTLKNCLFCIGAFFYRQLLAFFVFQTDLLWTRIVIDCPFGGLIVSEYLWNRCPGN
jgi:hypothetical protein